MEPQWHAFHILLILFIVKVSSDDIPPAKTSFLGLQGDINLGHSGYVHVSTDETNPVLELSSCQTLDINESTCHFSHKFPKPESALMVMRAWAAVTIRDNILGLLGYLLHQPNDDVFPEEIYSSLKLIYEQVRRNNIRTMDILPRLKSIAKANQVSQVIDLFRILQSVLPSYCKSAIDEIIRTFTKQKTTLKGILSPEPNDKGIDIFADIGLQIVPHLRSKIYKRSYDKTIYAEMGKEFAIFFSAIQESKIILTQPVLAVLMLNMRFSELSSEDREDFRLLTDVLRESKIPDWSPGLVSAVNVNSPYALVQMMVKAIANRSQIDPIVKDIAERLHNQLQKVPKSHRSKAMDPFFGKSELNIPLLLNVLEEETKTPEVETFKQMINDRTLSLSYALKGFIRYFYPTPRDLVLAFMRRIQNRVPMNNETATVVLKIISALQERTGNVTIDVSNNEHNETKSKRSIKFLDPACDFLGFAQSKGLNPPVHPDKQCIHGKRCFSKMFERIKNSFQIIDLSVRTPCPEEPPKMSLSSWLESLNTPAVNPNITSLLQNISTILTIFVKDPEINNIINDIIHRNTFNNSNQSINNSTQEDTSPLKSLLKSALDNTDEKVNSTDSTLSETKKDLLARILKDMLSIKKVRARRFVFYEVIRVYCILIHGSVEHMTQAFLNSLHLNNPPLSNITEILTNNVSESLKKVIQNLTANVNGSINLADYRTNQLYLTDLLRRLLLLDAVKQDEKLFNEVVQLLRPIQDLPIEFPPLMVMPYVPQVMPYLTTPGILQKLGEDFDMGRYATRGQLLRAILEKLLTTLTVKHNETLSKAIKTQISSVLCTGPGGEPVREILEGITTDQPNVYKIIQYGLDRQKLTANVQEAYANMWNWYSGAFEPLTHVKQMNVSLYDTRSEFLMGILDKLETKIEQDFTDIRGDIKLMRSAVLKTGTGAEPVDYL